VGIFLDNVTNYNNDKKVLPMKTITLRLEDSVKDAFDEYLSWQCEDKKTLKKYIL